MAKTLHILNVRSSLKIGVKLKEITMDDINEVVGHGGIVYANLYYGDIVTLESHLLRLANLAFSENKQRKAFIETLRRVIWFDWVENLDRIDSTVPVGMPISGIDKPLEE